MTESLIAYHCGPALAGIKPANIVACRKDKNPDAHTVIRHLSEQLICKDIHFEILCECEKRILLMVYKSKTLKQYLQREDIRGLLCSFGYNEKADLTEDINRLKSRLKKNDFPHEIGAFLGYPVHDIYGFINNKSKGCIFTGEWKVYENPEEAKKLFARYSRCRRAFISRLAQGKSLVQVLCAA